MTPEEISATGFFIFIFGLLITMFVGLFSMNILITSLFLLVSICFYYFIQILPYSEAKKDKYKFERSLEQLLLDYSMILESASPEEEVCFEIYREIEKLLILNSHLKENMETPFFPLWGPNSMIPPFPTPSKKLNFFLEHLNLYSKKFPVFLASFDYEMKANINNQTLDTKLSFFFFVAIFYPFGISILGLIQVINSPIYCISIAIFPVIIYKLRDIIMYSTLKLMGVNQNDLIELSTFINLLERFSVKLDFYPPDYSLLSACKELNKGETGNYNKDISLENIFNNISYKFKSPRIRIYILFIKKIVEKDSKLAYRKIFLMKERLNLQKNIEKQRVRQLKAQKVKIYCFSILLPIVLGILTGLYPTFSKFSLIAINLNEIPTSLENSFVNEFSINPFLFFGGMLLLSIITSYNFAEILFEKKKIELIVLTCFLFFISVLLSFISLKISIGSLF